MTEPNSELACDQEPHLLEVLASLSYRSGDLNAYLKTVAVGISQLIGTDWSIVTLCQTEQYRILASSLDVEDLSAAQALHGTVTNCVFASGSTLVIPDTTEATEYGRCPEGYAAYLGVPLKTPLGEILGTVCSFYRQSHNFTPEKIQLAEILAEQAAIAIDNYQLFQQQQLINAQYRQISERLRLVNADLARAVRIKDEFLANMSHELRTPLTAIIGLAEVLQDQVYGDLTPKQAKSVRTIEQSGQHLLELINDLLDLSKIESGNIELQLTPVSIRSLADSSLVFVKQQANQNHIQLSNRIAPDLIDIEADELRMRQVLLNLLSNAVKFTPNGGQVWLDAQDHPTEGVVQVSVADTGIGIAPEDIPKLFQPFVQVDSSFSRHYAGTGLGLALVQRIIDLHHGRIDVESNLGQGSCFTITLPRPSSDAELSIKPEEPVSHHQTPTHPSKPPASPLILLAEDREPIQLLLTDYLETQAYRVAIASNGLEAVEFAKTQSPDLILMDLKLPYLDGVEATHQIRAEATLAHIPIIALTSLLMPEDRKKFEQVGFNDCLSKPLDLERLLQVLSEHLSGD